jgi:signal peptidase II
MRNGQGLRRGDVLAIGALVALDQLTKALVLAYVPLHETITVIPGLLNLTHVRNTGAAFGVLNAADFPLKSIAVMLLALVALVAIGVYAARYGTGSWLNRLGLVCVLGGAIGNLIDRALRGYVVDFVDFYWGSAHFWAFNVADSAITIGAVALIAEMVFPQRHVSEAV